MLTEDDGGKLMEDSGSSNSLASQEGHDLYPSPLTVKCRTFQILHILTIVAKPMRPVTT